MIVFVLIGRVPWVLALALVAMLYLTWVELRHEELSMRVKLWWALLVGLFNVVGYVVMRVAIGVWRARGRPAIGRST